MDFIFSYKQKIIPIEVKSGHNAHLRSLHYFMDQTPHTTAVRIWSQPLSVDLVKTSNGKVFKLINVPFYYVGILESVVDRFA